MVIKIWVPLLELQMVHFQIQKSRVGGEEATYHIRASQVRRFASKNRIISVGFT